MLINVKMPTIFWQFNIYIQHLRILKQEKSAFSALSASRAVEIHAQFEHENNSKAVVLLLLTFCLLLLPLLESLIVLLFCVCYFMSILVLQSS